MLQGMQVENLLFAGLVGFGILLMFAAFFMPKTAGKRLVMDESGNRAKVASIAEATVVNSFLIDLSNRIKPQGKNLEELLLRSGMVYSSPEEYHTRRMIGALVCVVLGVLAGAAMTIGAIPTAMVATGAALFGFTMPDRAINGAINRRRKTLQREMGFGLDRIALMLGSGATISDGLASASGVGMFGEVCSHISSSIKTSRPINDVIESVLAAMPETPQLKSFMELIRVGIIQGQELTDPLREMAKTMRERLETEIVEAGQQAGIKVTLLTSGFIVVATLIVAVAPAVQTLTGSGLF